MEADKSCVLCGTDIPLTKRSGSSFCSRACQKQKSNLARNRANAQKQEARNRNFLHLNRDKAIGFDGRYGGPLNKSEEKKFVR